MKKLPALTHEGSMLLFRIIKHLSEERLKHTFATTKKGNSLWWACFKADTDCMNIYRERRNID